LGFFQIGRGSAGFNALGGARPRAASDGVSKAVTPTAQPSPATNEAFGFVQSAVNSLTSATAKLLEWGRIDGSRP